MSEINVIGKLTFTSQNTCDGERKDDNRNGDHLDYVLDYFTVKSHHHDLSAGIGPLSTKIHVQKRSREDCYGKREEAICKRFLLTSP